VNDEFHPERDEVQNNPGQFLNLLWFVQVCKYWLLPVNADFGERQIQK